MELALTVSGNSQDKDSQKAKHARQEQAVCLRNDKEMEVAGMGGRGRV